MAQRSRQLLAEVYTRLISDEASLNALRASNKPLRTYAHELAALTSKPAAVLGETDDDVKNTDQWLDQVEGIRGDLGSLDKKLEPITFLSGNAPTAADYSLFASLYDVVSTMPQQRNMRIRRLCATFRTCHTCQLQQTWNHLSNHLSLLMKVSQKSNVRLSRRKRRRRRK